MVRKLLDWIARMSRKPANNQVALPGGGDDWLDDDRDLRRFGYMVILMLFGFVGMWSAFAPIESAALAPGVVQVEGKRKAIQHYEGGIVDKIFVKNGEFVSEGQELLTLDATRDRAELIVTLNQVYIAHARVNRLQSERDDRTSIEFDDTLRSAAQSDSRAVEAMANETAMFNAGFNTRNGEELLLRQEISQLEKRLEGLRALKVSKTAVKDSVANEIHDLNQLLTEGYVDKQRIRELERYSTELEGGLSDLDAKISGANVSIREAELKILQSKKAFKSQVVEELAATLLDFYSLEQGRLTVEDKVERATIRTPVSGVVLDFDTNTEGAVIIPGETLMEVVPDIDKLVVEARVSPMDIDRVRVGLEAEVRFGVFKDVYTITGKVVKLSADILFDESTGEQYYGAEVVLLESDLSLLSEGMELVPGMPAEVLIKTGTRTPLGYVTSPLERMFSRSFIED